MNTKIHTMQANETMLPYDTPLKLVSHFILKESKCQYNVTIKQKHVAKLHMLIKRSLL